MKTNRFRLFLAQWIWAIILTAVVVVPMRAAHHISDHVWVHQAECQNYANFLFCEMNDETDKAIYAGNMPCYRDKDLKAVLSKSDIANSGEMYSEHVRVQVSPTDTATKDTVIYTPFDFMQVNQLVFFRDLSTSSGDGHGIYSVGLQYRHENGQKVLFYVAFKDFVKNLDAEETGFLNNFFDAGLALNNSAPNISLDSATMANFATNQIDVLDSVVFKAAKERQIKSYATDSLERPLPNVDYITGIDIPMGFVMIYYLDCEEDKIIFNKTGIGLLYYPLLNKTSLPEQPLFFNRYDDFKSYLHTLGHKEVDRAFQYCQMTAIFQIHNKWYKKDYWKGGVGHK